MSDWNWNQIQALHEIYKDRLREAERARLLWHVPEQRDKRDRRAHRVATWLGQRLVTWGCSLEEYGTRATDAAVGTYDPHPAGTCAMASCGK